MIVLVDMDGPLAQFELGVLLGWRVRYPKRPYIHLELRGDFWGQNQYEKLGAGFGSDASAIVDTPGFFGNLFPVPGAKEALLKLSKSWCKVAICSTPRPGLLHTEEEKMIWIERNLGKQFLKDVVFTQDKTLVEGNILIDDKPDIAGANLCPGWKQILWDMSFNRQSLIVPRVRNWQEALDLLAVKELA